MRGTTPRQLQNSASFIVESHDSEISIHSAPSPFCHTHPLSRSQPPSRPSFCLPPSSLHFPPFCSRHPVYFFLFSLSLSLSLFSPSLPPSFPFPTHIYFYIAVPFSGGFHSTCEYLSHGGVQHRIRVLCIYEASWMEQKEAINSVFLDTF